MNIRQTSDGIKEKTNALTDHVSELVELYYKLGVLNITEKATGIASTTVVLLIASFLSLFALLFLGFGLGWWIGQRLDNMLAGFAIIAGVFLLLVGILIIFRKQLLFPAIRNTIIKKVYE
jgi:hypothetical protein